MRQESHPNMTYSNEIKRYNLRAKERELISKLNEAYATMIVSLV